MTDRQTSGVKQQHRLKWTDHMHSIQCNVCLSGCIHINPFNESHSIHTQFIYYMSHKCHTSVTHTLSGHTRGVTRIAQPRASTHAFTHSLIHSVSQTQTQSDTQTSWAKSEKTDKSHVCVLYMCISLRFYALRTIPFHSIALLVRPNGVTHTHS